MTPLSPSMMGMVKPNHSLMMRLTEPFSPNSNSIATAPTKGGMIRGTTPRVWISTAPPKLNRVVK
jgi:hypothetical protein